MAQNEDNEPLAMIYLQAYRTIVESQPITRTNVCPNSQKLEEMLEEPGTNGPLRGQYLGHVVSCGYCANYVKSVLRGEAVR